jgi:hypothetical protein
MHCDGFVNILLRWPNLGDTGGSPTVGLLPLSPAPPTPLLPEDPSGDGSGGALSLARWPHICTCNDSGAVFGGDPSARCRRAWRQAHRGVNGGCMASPQWRHPSCRTRDLQACLIHLGMCRPKVLGCSGRQARWSLLPWLLGTSAGGWPSAMVKWR